jgi:signal peptidase II
MIRNLARPNLRQLLRDPRLIGMLLVVLSDQWLKSVMHQLLFEPMQRIAVTSFFHLTPVWNHGVGFGLLKQHAGVGVYALVGLALLLSVLLWRYTGQQGGSLAKWAGGLIIGGALGNAIDRLRFGAVVDFLDFFWRDAHWPAFNLADVSITIGVALLLLAGLRSPQPISDSDPGF